MSLELVAQAYRARTGSGVAKSVLVGLADQANAQGLCFPSISYIVERTEWDEKTVRRCIERLEQLGHITVIRRNGRGNLYQVHPKADDLTPVTKSGVKDGGPSEAPTGDNSNSKSAASSVGSSAPAASVVKTDGQPEGSRPISTAPTPVTKSGVGLSTTCGELTHTPVTKSGAPVRESGVPRSQSPDTPVTKSTESSLNRNLNRLLISEAPEPDGIKKSSDRKAGTKAETKAAIASLLPAASARRHRTEPTVHERERHRAQEVQRIERAMAAKGSASRAKAGAA